MTVGVVSFAFIASSFVGVLAGSQGSYDNLVQKKRFGSLNNGLNRKELKCGKFQLKG